jgi:hypothetical protein
MVDNLLPLLSSKLLHSLFIHANISIADLLLYRGYQRFKHNIIPKYLAISVWSTSCSGFRLNLKCAGYGRFQLYIPKLPLKVSRGLLGVRSQITEILMRPFRVQKDVRMEDVTRILHIDASSSFLPVSRTLKGRISISVIWLLTLSNPCRCEEYKSAMFREK